MCADGAQSKMAGDPRDPAILADVIDLASRRPPVSRKEYAERLRRAEIHLTLQTIIDRTMEMSARLEEAIARRRAARLLG